jgi:hypothetical protein
LEIAATNELSFFVIKWVNDSFLYKNQISYSGVKI